jgi:hypothetical protein
MFVLSESASQMKIGKDQFNEKEIDKLFVFRFVVFLILILIFFFFFFFFFEDVFFFLSWPKGALLQIVPSLVLFPFFANGRGSSMLKCGAFGRDVAVGASIVLFF